jgi:hypothetical protein
LAFPKYVVGGPITINGQNLKLYNNSHSSSTSTGNNVSGINGKPITAIWVSDKVQFNTDKGRAFRTGGPTKIKPRLCLKFICKTLVYMVF